MCVLIQAPRDGLKGSPRETGRCVAVVTKQYSSLLPVFPRLHTPLSSSQALVLFASPRVRRGVRVGSICLCDGHWCQAPWEGEGEERRLVWRKRVTDVSELSSGTLNGAEAEAGAGAGEREGTDTVG